MSDHHAQPSIDRLITLEAAYTGANAPELKDALAGLLAKIAVALRLSLRVDRRFFHLDLTNLVQSMEGIVAVEDAGIHTPDLPAALRDTLALVRDMEQRADLAIGAHVQQLSIHASVAAHRTSTSGPLDVTQAVRMLTAAPAPSQSDAPGVLVPVAPLAHTDHAKAYGRVSGASFSYMGPYDLQAAPKEAVVLPTGSVARFNEGDAFFLYHQGAAHGDRFAAPALETKGTGQVLVEAGQGGVVVHGPAVLECVPDCTRLLSESVQAKTTIKATTAAMIAPSPTRTLLGGLTLVGALFSAMLFFAMSDMPGTDSTTLSTMFSTMSVGTIIAFVSYITAAHVVDRKNRKNARACLEELPGHLRNGHLYPRIAHAVKKLGGIPRKGYGALAGYISMGFIERYDLGYHDHPVVEFGNAITRVQENSGGLNVIPAADIRAHQESDVRVMMPLLALPSPDSVVIPMPTARAKVRA